MSCRAVSILLVSFLFISAAWLYSTNNNNNNKVEVEPRQVEQAQSFPFVVLPNDLSTNNVDAMKSIFTSWAQAHGKTFASESEFQTRLAKFQASVDTIRKHNSQPDKTYELGLTEFADMTHEEFVQHFHLGFSQLEEDCSATKPTSKLLTTTSALQLPQSIDWRLKGGVGPVKNQGHCGSCWTFSTTGAIEAHLMLKSHKFVSLSEQELIDCAQHYDNHGCNGGLPSHAFQYVIENGGLNTDKVYPYEAIDSPKGCRARKNRLASTFQSIKLRSSFNITQYDERELETTVGSIGPVSVAFQVADDFRLYKSGVYTSKSCGNKPSDVNHAVLAVGYGVSSDGMKYWIIKNSWGTGWGEGGYFMMQRGVNMCGVAVCASFPILE